MVIKKGVLLLVALFLASAASLSLAQADMDLKEELDRCLDRCQNPQKGQDQGVMKCMAYCARHYYIEQDPEEEEESINPFGTMSPSKEYERCQRRCEGRGQRKTQRCIERCDYEEDPQCQQMCKEQGEMRKEECQKGCDMKSPSLNPSSITSPSKEYERCQRRCEGRGQRKTQRCIERCDDEEDPQCQQMCKKQGEMRKEECQERCDMKSPQPNPSGAMSHGKEFEKCQQHCLWIRNEKALRCLKSCKGENEPQCWQMCKDLDEMIKKGCEEGCDMELSEQQIEQAMGMLNAMERPVAPEVEEEFQKCEQRCQSEEEGYQQQMQCQKMCEQRRDKSQSQSQSQSQSRTERFKKCRSKCSGLGILQQVPCRTRCATEFGFRGSEGMNLESILDLVV